MRKQSYWGYIFTLPFIINVLVFLLFPIAFSAYISFTQYDLFNAPKWVGLDNWINVLKKEEFWISMRNVFYFALVFVPLQSGIAFIVAFMLNQAIRAKAMFRLFYFLPVVTPWLAGGVVWSWMFNYQYGVFNWFLSLVNIDPVRWLDSKSWVVVITSIALVNVWKGLGQSMIIILAGMQNVPKEVLEASQIDGASGWKQLTRIVFPMVTPMVYMVMILSTISAFHAFDVFLGLFGSIQTGIPERNMIPNLLVYRDSFLLFKMGPASAMAWLLFFVILVITLFQRYFEKKWVHYD
ncbi:ABC transporter permease [Paenibacillus sp. MY03]|jgi:multiple sugar transport system permease protein|uniref:carbohydrate ABC transporter permease n=1 Tax=Paenibacillus sp. MY03 TaxID=302980 RepID=UPI000B3C4ED9|nr:sugar ABC transporter permease [Paenibacillus sp. MY03]OUS74338.1 ABC transporter permease [Paenibacillus sp. MY03]